MKFTLNRQELADAVGVAGSVASARTPKPALQCVLIDVHQDYALVSATDLEVSVQCSVTQVQVDTPGSLLAPVDKLSQIVRESEDETLAFELTDGKCQIRGHDSHFTVYVLDPKEFPPVAKADTKSDFDIPVADLRRLSEWTIFAAARENTRYAINGVLWEKTADRLTLVATDGRRLAKADLQVSGAGEDRSATVPLKAMQVLSRVLHDGEGNVGIRLAGNRITLKSPRVTIGSTLLEGHFPRYQDVVPDDCDKRVELNKAEFYSAVRRAALLTNEESRGIKLSFSRGKLTLTGQAPEQGEAVIEVAIKYTGPDVGIGFNPVFLSDVLKAAKPETVTFEFKEPNRPGLFRAGEGFLYVVMPVNLS